MSSLNLAVKNNGVPIPAFKERGMSDLMPGSVSDVPVFALPGVESSELYESYMSEIQNVAYAQMESVIAYAKGPRVILKKVEVPFYLERPVASFIISASQEQKDALAAMGLNEEVGRSGVWLGSPDAAALPSIFGMGPVDGRIHPGTCTADAYLAYIYGLKAMALFSFASRAIVAGQYNLRMSGSYNTEMGKDKQFGLVRGDGSTVQVDMTHLKNSGFQVGVAGKALKGYINLDMTKKISPIIYSFDNLPNARGLFFPYFSGMVLPDKSILVEVFESTFLQCLSDKPESIQKIWGSLRPGFRNLALFKAGQALSHAFMGIKLAKMARAELAWVVTNHVYNGFVLHGDFSIGLYGSLYNTVEPEALKDSIRALNKHPKALGEILAIINGVCREDGTSVYAYSMNDVNTSRKLANVLMAIDYTLFVSTSWRDDLGELLGKLEFGDEFEVPTPKSIMAFLDYLAHGNRSVLNDYPFLITNRILVEKDRVAYGLAMFGSRVPSLNYGEKKNGKTITIPKANGQDPNLVQDAAGKTALPYLPFKFATYGQAVGDWRRLLNDGSFTIPNATKKGGSTFTDNRHVNVSVSGTNFLPAYQLLKIAVDGHRGTQGGGSKKRKLDGEEKGQVKKQRSEVIGMALEI